MPKIKSIEVLQFKKLTSTQKKARELSSQKKNFAVVAREQSAGKGRFDRIWCSDKGGIYCTICLEEKNPEHIKYLTFIAALAVVRTLRQMKIGSRIKWPNDVLINDKKVCGILTENIIGKKNIVLIGIGLNVNQKKFPKMDRVPTSLFLERGKQFKVEDVLGLFLSCFGSFYGLYKDNKFLEIRKLWKSNSNIIGRKIRVETIKGKIIGTAIDIDEQCNLLIKTKNKIKTIIEGDIFY